MKLAFVLYKYFPYGGLQRDFLRIARACVDNGHQVTAYALKWEGEKPDWIQVEVVFVSGWSSPSKYRKFQAWLDNELIDHPADLVVGFNKMPGLDVYYTADPCFEYKARNLRKFWYKYTARYRHFSNYERSIFKPGAATKILMISEIQQQIFLDIYRTEAERMALLPPGIARDRCAPENAVEIRAAFRAEFGLSNDDCLLLQVGSGFRTKGLDRTLQGLASLDKKLSSRCRLFVIGQDDPAQYKLMASRLGISDQVTFFSGRDDVPRFLQGADILIHPAYAENTGTVLLEAIVAGLPVLATDVCGYGRFVVEAQAGELVPSPFSPSSFNRQLAAVIRRDKTDWQKNALAFSQQADIYSMPERAAEVIEAALRQNLPHQQDREKK